MDDREGRPPPSSTSSISTSTSTSVSWTTTSSTAAQDNKAGAEEATQEDDGGGGEGTTEDDNDNPSTPSTHNNHHNDDHEGDNGNDDGASAFKQAHSDQKRNDVTSSGSDGLGSQLLRPTTAPPPPPPPPPPLESPRRKKTKKTKKSKKASDDGTSATTKHNSSSKKAKKKASSHSTIIDDGLVAPNTAREEKKSKNKSKIKSSIKKKLQDMAHSPVADEAVMGGGGSGSGGSLTDSGSGHQRHSLNLCDLPSKHRRGDKEQLGAAGAGGIQSLRIKKRASQPIPLDMGRDPFPMAEREGSREQEESERERESESEPLAGKEDEDTEEEDHHQKPVPLGQLQSPTSAAYVVPDPVLVKRYTQFDKAETIAAFNAHPQKGMKAMIEAGLVDGSPESVALFLYCCKRLDKAQIGEFIGDHKGLGRAVLNHFARLFNFVDLDFDIALRRFLSYFRLPGEAQKIDRIMNAFALQFYLHNKGDNVFQSADTVYILAFSVIMLNTDAHNPNIKKKMTEQEFVRTNRGINEGQDIVPEYLIDIYCRIVTNEIKMERESFPDALKMGWVWVKGEVLDERLRKAKLLGGKKTNRWYRLWFILCETGLHFYHDVRLSQPVGAVSLREVKYHMLTEERHEEELRRVNENNKKILHGTTSYYALKLITLHPGSTSLGERVFYLALPTQREMDVWISLLSKCAALATQSEQTSASSSSSSSALAPASQRQSFLALPSPPSFSSSVFSPRSLSLSLSFRKPQRNTVVEYTASTSAPAATLLSSSATTSDSTPLSDDGRAPAVLPVPAPPPPPPPPPPPLFVSVDAGVVSPRSPSGSPVSISPRSAASISFPSARSLILPKHAPAFPPLSSSPPASPPSSSSSSPSRMWHGSHVVPPPLAGNATGQTPLWLAQQLASPRKSGSTSARDKRRPPIGKSV